MSTMRLHLGASRPQLAHPKLASFRSSDWIHLGEPEAHSAPGATAVGTANELNYVSFFYKLSDRLPFADRTFSFIFSEHFFEHLFLDEACELFKECFRVSAAGGCLRVAVPDADLRTYQPPEPVGFSTGDKRWNHPDKHKSRWSIYSLSYVLSEVGFQTRGLVYCDKFGNYHHHDPQDDPRFYEGCPEPVFIRETNYILRYKTSLVIDAVRRS